MFYMQQHTNISQKWMDRTSDAQNFQPVDFFGFLRPLYRIMPDRWSTYKRNLRDISAIEDRLFFTLLDVAKANIAEGKVYPSFIRDMLLAKDRMSDIEIANNAAHGFGAATDTQWNTTLGFVKVRLPQVNLAHFLTLYFDRQCCCFLRCKRRPKKK